MTISPLLTAFGLSTASSQPLYRPDPRVRPTGHYFAKVGDGSVGFYLGMRTEPAYVLEPNGVEVFVHADVTEYNEFGEPVDGRNVHEGDPAYPNDKVELEATYQLLANKNPNGRVVAEKRIGKLALRESDIGYYLTEFMPNPAGRYALVFKGTINGQAVDTRVVCAYDSEETHTFSCVEQRAPSVL